VLPVPQIDVSIWAVGGARRHLGHKLMAGRTGGDGARGERMDRARGRMRRRMEDPKVGCCVRKETPSGVGWRGVTRLPYHMTVHAIG
jgi:hypothetical protein